MPDPTPHTEGTASAVEALPGAAIATILVYLSQFTKYPMDAGTGSALVLVASLASSYVLAFARRWVAQAKAAVEHLAAAHGDESVTEQARR
jgi:hypothetical protein